MRRHLDFEVDNWGEFPAAPTGTILAQSMDAAFPDRPGGQSGRGCRVTLAAGSIATGYLAIPHDPASSLVTIRFLFRATGLVGGTATVGQIRSAGGTVLGEMKIDAVNHTVIVSDVTGGVITVPYIPQIRWHCLEIALNKTTNRIAVRLDGITRADQPRTLSGLAASESRFGCPARDAGVSGTLDLDERIQDDAVSWIGPVVVTPTSPYADDPARWVVVYNRDSADSAAFAQAMHDRRGVPYANLVGLALPAGETITQAEFDALRSALGQYLDDNGLRGQTLGVCVGHGVPGRVTLMGGGVGSVASLLAVDAAPADRANPAGAPAALLRPTSALLNGVRLTARVDGPDLAASLAVLDRADALRSEPLDQSDSVFYLDPYGGKGAAGALIVAALETWSGAISAQRLRVPVVKSALSDPGVNVNFAAVSNEGFFWGWTQPTVSDGFFAAPAGRRTCAVQIEENGDALGLLRSASASEFGASALRSGYAAVIAACGPAGMTAVPDAQRFMEALRLGWTVAEAWMVARPLVDDSFTLTGDPFLTVLFARAGIDLYGGPGEVSAQNHDAPIACFRPGQVVSAPASAFPIEGGVCSFALRAVNSEGLAEASMRWESYRRVGGVLRIRPTLPGVPCGASWRPRRQGDGLQFEFRWALPPRGVLPIALALLRQDEQLNEAQVDGGSLAAGEKAWNAVDSPGNGTHRYRLRMTTADGVVEYGPFSMWLRTGAPVAVDMPSAVALR